MFNLLYIFPIVIRMFLARLICVYLKLLQPSSNLNFPLHPSICFNKVVQVDVLGHLDIVDARLDVGPSQLTRYSV